MVWAILPGQNAVDTRPIPLSEHGEACWSLLWLLSSADLLMMWFFLALCDPSLSLFLSFRVGRSAHAWGFHWDTEHVRERLKQGKRPSELKPAYHKHKHLPALEKPFSFNLQCFIAQMKSYYTACLKCTYNPDNMGCNASSIICAIEHEW